MAMYTVVAEAAPGDATTGSIIGAVLNYGILGIVTLAFAWLFYKGWRLVPPAQEAAARAAAREEARADLLKELERTSLKLDHTEQERDDALKVARVELVPVLIQFTNTTTALIPLLQEVVRSQEGRRRGEYR